MKWSKRFRSTTLAAAVAVSLAASAQAADYSFTTDAPQDYYGDTSYEEIYGSQYNYGGRNLVDFQVPELEYGLLSSTQTGVMERSLLPGLQQSMANRYTGSNSYASDGGISYGISDGEGLSDSLFPDGLSTADNLSASILSAAPQTVQNQQTSFTSADELFREDGSIGTIKIPSLGISMKVWEGETTASMKKGLGHYSSTSAWDGNVGVCGHNRGAKHVIGSI